MNTMTDDLPQRVKNLLGNEVPDFVVRAKHAYGWQRILFPALWSFGWFIVVAIFFVQSSFFTSSISWEIVPQTIALITEIIRSRSLEAVTFTEETGLSVVMVVLVLSFLFELVGVLYRYFKKGGYFVGTPTRFLYTKEGSLKSVRWDDLDQDIQVESKLDRTGTIYLQMKSATTKMATIDSRLIKSLQPILPTTISMTGIEDAEEVAQAMRRRISLVSVDVV